VKGFFSHSAEATKYEPEIKFSMLEAVFDMQAIADFQMVNMANCVRIIGKQWYILYLQTTQSGSRCVGYNGSTQMKMGVS